MASQQLWRRVGGAIRRWWLLFLGATLVITGGAAGYAQTMPDTYTASTLVAIEPRADTEKPVAAQVVFLTAPRYVAYVTAPVVLREVAGPLKMNPDALEEALTVSMAPNTANLDIAITLNDRDKAARVANALADAVVERTKEDPILSANIISRAQVPVVASGPPRNGIVLAVGVLSLFAAAMFVVMVDKRRRS